MNEQRAFWKGFVLAGGLAVVFMAGRVSAGPIPTPKVLDDTASAVKDATRKIDDVASELSAIRRDGIQIKGAYNSSSYPIYVKEDK